MQTGLTSTLSTLQLKGCLVALNGDAPDSAMSIETKLATSSRPRSQSAAASNTSGQRTGRMRLHSAVKARILKSWQNRLAIGTTGYKRV